MTDGDADVAAAVTTAYRREWPVVVATIARMTRDLDLAEDCAQEAFAAASATWPRDGVPARPGAWLTTAARRRALDAMRRQAVDARVRPLLVVDAADRAGTDPARVYGRGLDDDRLRLVFTCCHPALDAPARVALTLRLVCGLSTAEVARAFLVPEPTMAARLTRAKKKIAVARIPFRVPDDDHLAERVDSVLDVVYLVFTSGHTAGAGAELARDDLADLAYSLARLLHELLPRTPEVAALLALILLISARRATRVGDRGEPIALAEQDRSQWDRRRIAEGAALAARSLRAARSRFALQASIAAVHAQAPTWAATDWHAIADRYDELLALWPSPVVALNRAVAIGFRDGPEAGLSALEPVLSDPLAHRYPYVAAAHADLLARAGRHAQAGRAYREAIAASANDAERSDLRRRLALLPRVV